MKTIQVSNSMQENYSYKLEAPMGEAFAEGFAPELTAKEMLRFGVFEGKYLNECREEYPADWFEDARLSDVPDVNCNAFKIKSRQPLSVWREKGWVIEPDPRGWFEWYCRYYMGRRIKGVDDKQIKRWRSFARHKAQILKNCPPMALECRPRQRQGLLQWAYDPFF